MKNWLAISAVAFLMSAPAARAMDLAAMEMAVSKTLSEIVPGSFADVSAALDRGTSMLGVNAQSALEPTPPAPRAAAANEPFRQEKSMIAMLAGGLGQLDAGNIAHQIAATAKELRADLRTSAEKLRQAALAIDTGAAQGSNLVQEVSTAAAGGWGGDEPPAADPATTVASLDDITGSITQAGPGSARDVVSSDQLKADGQAIISGAMQAADLVRKPLRRMTKFIGTWQSKLLAFNEGPAPAGDASPLATDAAAPTVAPIEEPAPLFEP